MGCEDVKQDIGRLYRDRQVYLDATNAILVGAALVASVTFQGWLQPPEFDDSTRARRWVRVFWWCNSVSFFFSVASVTVGAAAALPMGKKVYIGRSVQRLRYWLSLTSLLLMISLVHVLIAFAGSGFAALTMSVSKLEKNMTVTTSVGMALCFAIILSVLFRLRGLVLDFLGFPSRAFKLLKAIKNYGGSNLLFSLRRDAGDLVERITGLNWSIIPIVSMRNLLKTMAKLHFDQCEDFAGMYLDVKGLYERERGRMNVRSRQTKMLMQNCSYFDLMARGIYHRMTGCPVEACREFSLGLELHR